MVKIVFLNPQNKKKKTKTKKEKIRQERKEKKIPNIHIIVAKMSTSDTLVFYFSGGGGEWGADFGLLYFRDS